MQFPIRRAGNAWHGLLSDRHVMETLWQDLRFAVRMLLKRPGPVLTAVTTLGLGIGATTAIFSVVHGVLFRPLPYPQPERLVALREVSRDGNQMNVPEQNFLDWQVASRSYERMAFYNAFETSITGGSEPVRALVSQVSSDFFEVLKVKPFLGRGLVASEAPSSPAAVVSYAYWRRYLGGDTNLEGKQVRGDGYVFALVGVMPPGFAFPSRVDVWVAKSATGPVNPSRSAHNWRVIARLAPNATLASSRVELSQIAKGIHGAYTDVTAVDATVLPLVDVYAAGIRPALWLLAGAVGLLLLIACANVMNLMLARATARENEFAVRRALGATRARLVRQSITESLVLAVLAAGLGTLLASWGVDALLKLGGGDIPRADDVRVDAIVLGFSLALAVVTAVLLGFVPGWRAGRSDLHAAMSDGERGGSSRRSAVRIRSALVVSQVALTLVLLVGAGLLARSFAHVMVVDLGFQKENRLELDLQMPFGRDDQESAKLRDFARRLEERLGALPGVLSVGGSSSPPMSPHGGNGRFEIEGGRNSKDYWPSYAITSPGYFETLGIPILSGRGFDASDGVDTPHVAVISRDVAEHVFFGEDPISRRINTSNMDGDETWITIVGVAGDVKNLGPEAATNGAIYTHYLQRGKGSGVGKFTWVLHTAGDPEALVPSVRRAVLELDPEVAPKFETLEHSFHDTTASRRFNLILIFVFTAVALTLAGLGIYGVLAYSVELRTREIGIRMALGAQADEVRRMIVWEGMRLVALGTTFGLAAAFALTRLLTSLLFGVSRTDPLTYVGTIAFLAALALAASWVPARRAMKVEPMRCLRHE
jgi:putative ABC transport system permease protein